MLVALDMGNVDAHVADLGAEQQPLPGLDPHPGVLDEHVALDLLHLGPARLEVQGRVVHFEEQADIAGMGWRTMVQRTLVLEVAFIDIALDDGATQPFVQGRAEHFGQVFGGVAAIALGEADTQVHVVFMAWLQVDADQEVGGDLAFIAQHLDIGATRVKASLSSVQVSRALALG